MLEVGATHGTRRRRRSLRGTPDLHSNRAYDEEQNEKADGSKRCHGTLTLVMQGKAARGGWSRLRG